jgi:DNA processing protein
MWKKTFPVGDFPHAHCPFMRILPSNNCNGMYRDLPYQLALKWVPHIGDFHSKMLVKKFGTAEQIFKARKKDLEHTEGIGSVRAAAIKNFSDFGSCDKEIAFLEKYAIRPLFFTGDEYPKRLLHCYDSPALLFYKGSTGLNPGKAIAIVGTRNHSEYGKWVCEKLIEELKPHGALIISGLAFGIDTIAHKAALRQELDTVGVLAHGLHGIYPPQNKGLAKQMVQAGGLLTEFPSDTEPEKMYFPRRNRIVAGLCDAVVVIETKEKGGSMITAELANSYNRDVFAIPGRCSDARSEGCHYLIKNNKAALITGADDLLAMMNWLPSTQPPAKKRQRELFIELSAEEQRLVSMLQEKEQVHIDELYLGSGLSSSVTAATLLQLEMNGIVACLPGKMYRIS